MRRGTLPYFAATALVAWTSAAQAAIYTVNSTADLPDADPTDSACATAPPMPVCTLRAAVMQANGHPGLDYISVPAGTYVLTRVGYDQTAYSGDLDVTDDLQIVASGGPVIIDANGAVTADRAFEVASGSLTLYGITIKNGNTPSYGGAIYAQGNLTLTNVAILDNTTALEGGGVYATADVKVDSSLFEGNTAQSIGGGGGLRVSSSGSASATVKGSEFADNHADSGDGGGIGAYGADVQVDTTWFHDNSAWEGGGMSYGSGIIGIQLAISNSSFEHNTAAGSGGGLSSNGNDTISDTYFAGNSAQIGTGGGMYGYYGTHTLIDVEVSHNNASTGGGLSEASGNLSVRRGQIDHNTATQSGGGIAAGGLGTIVLTLNDSTVFNNSASDGGGVYTSMEFVATTSTIYRNGAARGGGVFIAGGETTIDDSTISGNLAGSSGGGVFLDSMGSLKLDSATLANNIAHTNLPTPGSGGALYITSPASTLANATVFSGNRASPLILSYNDCAGALTLGNSNFMSTNAGCTIAYASGAAGNHVGDVYPNILNVSLSPLLRLYNTAPTSPPLASPKYGHVPLTGSPLIDAGPASGCKAGSGGALQWDLIGQPRVIGVRCDAGAVEFGAAIDGIFEDSFDS